MSYPRGETFLDGNTAKARYTKDEWQQIWKLFKPIPGHKLVVVSMTLEEALQCSAYLHRYHNISIHSFLFINDQLRIFINPNTNIKVTVILRVIDYILTAFVDNPTSPLFASDKPKYEHCLHISNHMLSTLSLVANEHKSSIYCCHCNATGEMVTRDIPKSVEGHGEYYTMQTTETVRVLWSREECVRHK